jgi:hypothetical protein
MSLAVTTDPVNYALLPAPKNQGSALKFYNLSKNGTRCDVNFAGEVNPNLLVWADKNTGRTTVHLLINVCPPVAEGFDEFQKMLSGIQPDATKHRKFVRENGDIKIKMNFTDNEWSFKHNIEGFKVDVPIPEGTYQVYGQIGAYLDDKGMCGLFFAMKELSKF